MSIAAHDVKVSTEVKAVARFSPGLAVNHEVPTITIFLVMPGLYADAVEALSFRLQSVGLRCVV